MKTGIIFDLDGTLLDTLTDLADAVNHILRKYNCPERSVENVRRIVGNGVRNLVHNALPNDGRALDEEIIIADYREYYAAHSMDKTCPYDGIVEALAQLGKKYPLAVVSNKPDSQVKPLCKAFFGDIYVLGECEEIPRKPAPDMLLKAMTDMGVERCVYVGDSEVDVLTARNTGVPCLSVLWGFRDLEVLEAAGGKYFCSSPWELMEKIEEIIANEE